MRNKRENIWSEREVGVEEKLIKTVLKNFVVWACENFQAYTITMTTCSKPILDNNIRKGLFCKDEALLYSSEVQILRLNALKKFQKWKCRPKMLLGVHQCPGKRQIQANLPVQFETNPTMKSIQNPILASPQVGSVWILKQNAAKCQTQVRRKQPYIKSFIRFQNWKHAVKCILVKDTS